MINVLSCKLYIIVQVMVLIIDGNSEIGAHVWSYFGYLICERLLFRSRVVANLNYYLQKIYIFFIM